MYSRFRVRLYDLIINTPENIETVMNVHLLLARKKHTRHTFALATIWSTWPAAFRVEADAKLRLRVRYIFFAHGANMESPGYEELVLLQASLTDTEFQWRGTAHEINAWKSKLAAFERGECPSPDTMHFSLRVSEALGIWMNVSLVTGSHEGVSPGITMVSSNSIVSLDKLNELVDQRRSELSRESTCMP